MRRLPKEKCLLLSLGLESDALDSKVLQISPLTSPHAIGTCLLSTNTTKKIQETVKLPTRVNSINKGNVNQQQINEQPYQAKLKIKIKMNYNFSSIYYSGESSIKQKVVT